MSKKKPVTVQMVIDEIKRVAQELGCDPSELKRSQLLKETDKMHNVDISELGGFLEIRNNYFPKKSKLPVVVEEIQRIADEMELHPLDLKAKDIFKRTELFKPTDINNLGGLSHIKKAHFPVVGKDYLAIQEQKDVGSHIRDLEKQLTADLVFQDMVKKMIRGMVQPIKVAPYKPKKKAKLHREVCVEINDTHIGLRVDFEEVSHTNCFSAKETARRFALLAKHVIEYKIEKRDEHKHLHVIINGDVINGLIHGKADRGHELLIHQQNEALHILQHFIAAVSAAYPKVTVHAISGNHDDNVYRREGGRITSHKYDSFIHHTFYALSIIFKGNKHINFSFPKGLHGDIQLPAGRAIYAHGDTEFSTALGNPGTALKIKEMSNVIAAFNSGEIVKGKEPAKLFLFGHVHSYIEFTTFDGTNVVVAPSLSGIDAYANSLTINHNNIGQVIFESTPKHIKSDLRLVNLIEADDDESLDEIIPMYNKELKHEGN